MQENNIRLDNYQEERGPVEIPLLKSKDSSFYKNFTQNLNSSVYMHVYFVKKGFSPDPSDSSYRKSNFFYSRKLQNRFIKPAPLKNKKNLLSSGSDEEISTPTPTPTPLNTLNSSNIQEVSHWNSNLTINLIDDLTVYPRGQVLPHIQPIIKFNDQGNYPPMVFFNEFWTLSSEFHPINSTNYSNLNVTFSYYLLASWKFHLLLQMQQSLDMQLTLGAAQKDTDDVKEMLLTTNPYFLAITFFVSLLHSVFDFLAFKNDITFWKNRKTMAGLSIRTIFWNTAMQCIIFLYLLDNDTSFLILLSTGVGILIESWKITKAVKITIIWNEARTFPKWIQFEDRESYSAQTREYDETAMRYLSYVLYPLSIGYAVYNLYTNTYKSWYSWIISSLTGCIYTFGFVMMTPQLFINYKLKSVAAMPWKTFMYKALNTFIDDLFAFVIKMPLMHRMACFRDDLVFVIFLYQRWIYRVDPKRLNEYGQGGGDDVDNNNTTTPGGSSTTDPNSSSTTTPTNPNTGKKEGEVFLEDVIGDPSTHTVIPEKQQLLLNAAASEEDKKNN